MCPLLEILLEVELPHQEKSLENIRFSLLTFSSQRHCQLLLHLRLSFYTVAEEKDVLLLGVAHIIYTIKICHDNLTEKPHFRFRFSSRKKKRKQPRQDLTCNQTIKRQVWCASELVIKAKSKQLLV